MDLCRRIAVPRRLVYYPMVLVNQNDLCLLAQLEFEFQRVYLLFQHT